VAIIEKKIWPENFKKVLSGEKTYEPRLSDFAIQEGDELLLREWNPGAGKYTGRSIRKRVKDILKLSPSEIRKYWSQDEIEKHGIQVIRFE
jgi:hypothetical protein